MTVVLVFLSNSLRRTHFHPREVVWNFFLLYLCIYLFVFQSRGCSTVLVFALHDQTASIWRWLYSAVLYFRCDTCILFSFVAVRLLLWHMRWSGPSLPPSACGEGASDSWDPRQQAQPCPAQPCPARPTLRCQPNPVNRSSRYDKVNEPLCSLTHESIRIITQRQLKLRVNEGHLMVFV